MDIRKRQLSHLSKTLTLPPVTQESLEHRTCRGNEEPPIVTRAKRPEIRVDYSTDRLRQLGSLYSKPKGKDFGTEETEAFLTLYGQDLVDKLNQTVRDFLKQKLA